MEGRKILIGVTGSVAAIKIGEIVDRLLDDTTFKFEVSFHWKFIRILYTNQIE